MNADNDDPSQTDPQRPASRPRLIALGELTVQTLLGPESTEYWIRPDRSGRYWQLFEGADKEALEEVETFSSTELLEFLAGYNFFQSVKWWQKIGMIYADDIARWQPELFAEPDSEE